LTLTVLMTIVLSLPAHIAGGSLLLTIDRAVKKLLPDAVEIEKEVIELTIEQKVRIKQSGDIKGDRVLEMGFVVFIGKKEGTVTGYAAEDSVRGKWGPIRYMLSMDPEGKVMDIVVLEYIERRGKPVAKRRFLKQFIGKGVEDRIRLNKDIRGITGASISSRGMANGVRKMVRILNEVYLR